MINKTQIAFTLAEMLLTIFLIGVVAGIALPTLKDTSDKNANIALVKKAYSNATNAFAQLQAELGSPIYWMNPLDNKRVFTSGDSVGVASLFKRKITSQSFDDYDGATYLNGSASDSDAMKDPQYGSKISYSGNNTFRSSDGLYWFFSETYTGCQRSVQGQTYDLCGLIMVDINGVKKPNRLGIDVFVFDITTDGVVPHFSETDDCNDMSGAGFTCSSKVIRGGEKSLDFIYE